MGRGDIQIYFFFVGDGMSKKGGIGETVTYILNPPRRGLFTEHIFYVLLIWKNLRELLKQKYKWGIIDCFSGLVG